MLKDTLAWRHTYGPHRITPEEVAHESTTGKIYVNGHDRSGRPVLILCPGRENTSDADSQRTAVAVYALSRARARSHDALGTASQLTTALPP